MTETAEVRAQPREYPFGVFRGDLPAEVIAMVHDQPVSRVRLPDGRQVWLVLGYREIRSVLTDPRFVRHGGVYETGADTGECPVRQLNMDGRNHDDLRKLAASAFTPRRIERYRPLVEAITEELLDAMEAAGSPGDLVAGLVRPLPERVICAVLGLPTQDAGRFAEWERAVMSVDTFGASEPSQGVLEMRRYLGARLAEKRADPGDDMLSAWATARSSGDALNDEEITGLAVSVLLGGREIGSISAGMRVLFQRPEVMDRLRADPALLPKAVDELIRLAPLSPTFPELTLAEDLELAGVQMREGDSVMPLPWAANHDTSIFTEPGEIRLDRREGAHMTFGVGQHYCLGAALGRLEIETAIGALLRRFPRLRAAVPIAELPWRNERINCGLAAFPVAW